MKKRQQPLQLQGRVWVSPNPFLLSCGEELPCFELAYQTWGALNSRKDNAILVCPALNASHIASSEEKSKNGYIGWWSSMVGPGRPIDTDRFYVVCVSNFGTCFGSTGPRSKNPSTKEFYGPYFPPVTINDWVRSQALLAEHLGIAEFAAVVGGSLGGMQALEWALAFPDRVRHIVAIATTSRLSAQNLAFNEIARQAILCDPDFSDGNYEKDNRSKRHGLRLARMLAHITYTSAASLEQKFGRIRCLHIEEFLNNEKFKVGAYLTKQGDRFSQYFDVHSYLRIMHALDDFDIAREYGNGSLTHAMQRIKCKFLLIAFSDDWRFGPECSREIEKALHINAKQVVLHELQGSHGHDGFLLDNPAYHQVMRSYFSSVADNLPYTSIRDRTVAQHTSRPFRISQLQDF